MSSNNPSRRGAGTSRGGEADVVTTTRTTRNLTDVEGDSFAQSFRQRSYQGLHAGLRAKLARAQYVLWKDPEGYQRGESLSLLNRAVSAFLAEAPLGRGAKAFEAQVEAGPPRSKSGARRGMSGRNRSRET